MAQYICRYLIIINSGRTKQPENCLHARGMLGSAEKWVEQSQSNSSCVEVSGMWFLRLRLCCSQKERPLPSFHPTLHAHPICSTLLVLFIDPTEKWTSLGKAGSWRKAEVIWAKPEQPTYLLPWKILVALSPKFLGYQKNICEPLPSGVMVPQRAVAR